MDLVDGRETIDLVTADGARALLPQLAALLQDAVDDGASIGFLRPLSSGEARRYWTGVADEVAQGARLLLVARVGERVVGSAQLGLCTRPNGLHRAEVQKVMVHTSHRGRGAGKRLMQAVEAAARAAGRRLLYLDTEPDRPAEAMYVRLGYARAGAIPDYACTPDGTLHPTVIYYKQLA